MPLRIAPTYRAAWVPSTAELPRDAATELAIAWLEERAAESGSRALLVTNDKMTMTVTPRLLTFARRHHFATPRMSGSGPRGVPVLAYRPDQIALHLALERAHGSVLCVVEGAPRQVEGWASVTPALDLTRPAQVGAGVDEEWLRTVTRLASDEHGLMSPPEPTLALLSSMGPVRRAQLPTALIARGASMPEVRRMGKLLDVVEAETAR